MSKVKLTPQLQKRFTQLVRAGNFKKTACSVCHITYETYLNWMHKGEVESEGIYRDFYEAVKEAEGFSEAELVDAWRDKVHDDWRAAQGLLQARFKERWSPKVEIDTKVEVKDVDSTFNTLLGLLGFEPLGEITAGQTAGTLSGDRAPEALETSEGGSAMVREALLSGVLHTEDSRLSPGDSREGDRGSESA